MHVMRLCYIAVVVMNVLLLLRLKIEVPIVHYVFFFWLALIIASLSSQGAHSA